MKARRESVTLALGLLLTATGTGCTHGTPTAGDHEPLGTVSQAVLNCGRDLRIDPLQAGPSLVSNSGMQLVTLGQETTRNGVPVIVTQRRSGLVTSRWSATTGQWTPFEMVLPSATHNPALMESNGYLNVYTLDATGRPITFWLAGSTVSSPTSLGTMVLDSSPAVVGSANGVRFFARATESRTIVERLANDRWVSVGEQQVTSAPAVVALNGRVVLFARGLDDGLLMKTEVSGTWSPWRRVPGWTQEITSAPSATLHNGTILVHAVNRQGAVIESYSTDGGDTWWPGTVHPLVATSAPAAAFDGTRIFLTARDASGERLVVRPWEAGWRDVQPVTAGTVTTNLCAAAAAAHVTNDTVVRSACTANIASTDLCGPNGCITVARWPCYPWGCDGNRCRTRGCISDRDCAVGATCDQNRGVCEAFDFRCMNSFTLISAGGVETSCAPYQCAGAACRDECVTTYDCMGGYECRGGRCLPPPPPPPVTVTTG